MKSTESLAYEDHGHGEPVLLIHGAAIATTFVPVTREPTLADRYRLIRYHRRGFTGSAPIEDLDTLSGRDYCAVHVQDALSLLRHTGIERVHVIGHSGGGWVALQLTRDAPSVVHSLVLMEPAIHEIDPEFGAAVLEFVSPIVELGHEDPERAAERLLSSVEGTEWRVLAETMPGGATAWFEDTKRMLFEFTIVHDWSFDAEDANTIAQPVLYITGGDSGSHVEVLRDRFQSLVPQTESAVIPEASHNMLTSQPARVAQEIVRFLDRHPMDV